MPAFAACAVLAAAASLATLSVARSCAAEGDLPGLEGIPEIVAEVDGRPIRRLELIRELLGASGTKALERLVHRTLIEQAAAEQHITVTDQDIEMQYKLDKNDLAEDLINVVHNSHDPVPMEETVRAKYGMSVAEYKNTIIRQRLLARRCMASDVNPSEDDLRKFFNAFPEMFQELPSYRAAHILISPLNPGDIINLGGRAKSPLAQMFEHERLKNARVDRYRDDLVEFKENETYDPATNTWKPTGGATPNEEISDAWRASKAQAEQYVRELQKNPGKWNDYVKLYSRDPMDRVAPIRKVGANAKMPLKTAREEAKLLPGEVGWFNRRGPMVDAFYFGAKNIPVGQIGGPIQSPFGWHIVKMLDVKFPPIVTFEQCREKARRLYIENEIQLRSESWLAQLAARADLKTEKATLWPPKNETVQPQIGLVEIAVEAKAAPESDPVVGRINGVPLKRSEVWHELLRTEGEEALTRLINREVVLTILKDKGVPYMEWLCSSPDHRSPNAPPLAPIRIKEEAMQRDLNDDRLDYDRLVNAPEPEFKEYASLTFAEFIYRRYGQTEAEHRRAIEASLILRAAIRKKIVPADEREFEGTLKLEFAMAREQYSQSAWFEISHIMIVPTGGMLRADDVAKGSAMNIAQNILAQYVANPESWAELVDKYSDDTPENKTNHGRLSGCYMDRNPPDLPESAQFYKEIKDQNLEAGQVTPVLKSARGFHIVRLDRKHKAQQADFREKRDQIERDYINEQAKYYADVWLRALNSRAIIKHYLYKPTITFEDEKAFLPPDHFPTPRE